MPIFNESTIIFEIFLDHSFDFLPVGSYFLPKRGDVEDVIDLDS